MSCERMKDKVLTLSLSNRIIMSQREPCGKQQKVMLKTRQTITHLLRTFSIFLLCALLAPALTSCDDNEPETDLESIVDTWEFSESASDDDSSTEIKMVLTFNSDHTGVISETWVTQSRASSSATYTMNFSWSTTSDSNGNNILKISYVSGDKNILIFGGGSNTVLWSRQYILTGTILNIHSGDSGVWVFHRK